MPIEPVRGGGPALTGPDLISILQISGIGNHNPAGSMLLLLDILLGTATLGLPLWFAYLDRGAFPRLRWVEQGKGPPPWGRAVVFVGLALALLVALAAPIAGFDPGH